VNFTEESAIEIRVIATPAPQGSKGFMGIKGGKGILIESCKRVKPWRESVVWAAREAGGRVAGPVSVTMAFTLPKPKSAPKGRKTWPDRKPDLSKLVRSTEDALTDAGVWEDDARVIQCVATKMYPGEGANALDIPGVIIWISKIL
jgi:Holliday junction resolvase RusA-like endonuclease